MENVVNQMNNPPVLFDLQTRDQAEEYDGTNNLTRLEIVVMIGGKSTAREDEVEKKHRGHVAKCNMRHFDDHVARRGAVVEETEVRLEGRGS